MEVKPNTGQKYNYTHEKLSGEKENPKDVLEKRKKLVVEERKENFLPIEKKK